MLVFLTQIIGTIDPVREKGDTEFNFTRYIFMNSGFLVLSVVLFVNAVPRDFVTPHES